MLIGFPNLEIKLKTLALQFWQCCLKSYDRAVSGPSPSLALPVFWALPVVGQGSEKDMPPSDRETYASLPFLFRFLPSFQAEQCWMKLFIPCLKIKPETGDVLLERGARSHEHWSESELCLARSSHPNRCWEIGPRKYSTFFSGRQRNQTSCVSLPWGLMAETPGWSWCSICPRVTPPQSPALSSSQGS